MIFQVNAVPLFLPSVVSVEIDIGAWILELLPSSICMNRWKLHHDAFVTSDIYMLHAHMHSHTVETC